MSITNQLLRHDNAPERARKGTDVLVGIHALTLGYRFHRMAMHVARHRSDIVRSGLLVLGGMELDDGLEGRFIQLHCYLASRRRKLTGVGANTNTVSARQLIRHGLDGRANRCGLSWIPALIVNRVKASVGVAGGDSAARPSCGYLPQSDITG